MIRFADHCDYSLLVLFGDSTGEIDWLLPVLHTMKMQEGTKLNLSFIIVSPGLQQKLDSENFYGVQLRSLGNVFAHGKERIGSKIDFSKVDVMLKADDPDNEVTNYYRTLLPDIPVVVFPSGTAILSRKHDSDDYLKNYFDFIHRKTGREIRGSHGPHALWLTTSSELEPMARQFSTPERIVHIGCPRYEKWWMDRIKPECRSSEQHTILFVIRGPHWLYQSVEDYESLMHDFMSEICRRENTIAVIKPHPRQDRQELELLLSAYHKTKWSISDLSLTELTQSADAVVCMFSSGVLDAIAADKPVAEFFHYHDREPVMEYRRARDGRMISIYEDLGLVRNLTSREELSDFLTKVLAGESFTTDERKTSIFDSVTMRRQSPSKRASDAVLNLVKSKRVAASAQKVETVLC
jgi:hypothetical protein